MNSAQPAESLRHCAKTDGQALQALFSAVEVRERRAAVELRDSVANQYLTPRRAADRNDAGRVCDRQTW